jgi:hypothetical protein
MGASTWAGPYIQYIPGPAGQSDSPSPLIVTATPYMGDYLRGFHLKYYGKDDLRRTSKVHKIKYILLYD